MAMGIEADPRGTLTIRQSDGARLRHVLGVPMLAGGVFLLYGAISSLAIRLREEGIAGLPIGLVASFLLVLFGGLLTPMGWWLVLSRHWIAIEPGTGDVVQVSDWRIGRRETRVNARVFRVLRVALEPINDSSSSRTNVPCQTLRLLPKDLGAHRSLELGWFDADARADAVAAAQRLAQALNVPVEIAAPDAVLQSPERAMADAETLEDRS